MDHSSQTPYRAEGAKALLAALLAQIAGGHLREGFKLPAERALSEQYGASRGAVRRVLQDLKARGLITQTVGSGTFVSANALASREVSEQASVLSKAQDISPTSPAELMEARILIEPLMPPLIVCNATAVDFSQMDECIHRSEAASSIELFEHWDGALHRAFARATHNAFFLQVLDLTNRIREQGEWGRLKRRSLTPERREAYQVQHRQIVAALKDRDAEQATDFLRAHLYLIQRNLFGG